MTINLSTYAQITMTKFIKRNEIKKSWLLIDAENLVVGRLAAYISIVLRGKNKTKYTPGMDAGDFIIVTNVEKIKFSGKKLKNKKYYRHTGHPGGIKVTTPFSDRLRERFRSELTIASKISSTGLTMNLYFLSSSKMK